MCAQLVLVYLVASSLVLCGEGSRTCPRGCNCDDQQLIARCDKSAQLDYVPHTLNPAVKSLQLSNNNIRGIKSAFEVYKNLIFLDLSGNNLQILGERNFHANSKIETILLRYNNFSEIQPNAFVGLSQLKRLDLSFNIIEALNGTVFKHLQSLQYLDLSFNNLKNINSNVFVGLFNLTQLNVSNNFIVNFSPNLFENIPNLLSFNASYNQLDQLPQDLLYILVRLENLDFSNCLIKNIEKFAFRGLKSLRNLFLENNLLESIPSDAFFENNIIQLLNIGYNHFQSLSSHAFSNLKRLQFLYISNNSFLNHVHYNAFYGLENLELLELSNNENLGLIDRNVFDNLFSLSSLILSNNNFNTLEVDLITRYKKSDLYLDVRGNPFNCNCSLEWLNFHFIRMFNKTVSANAEFLGRNYSFTMYNIDGLFNNNFSDAIIRENAMEVKCASPFALENKLIIKLHKDKFGCFVIESFIPIIVGAVIGLLLITGVIVLCIIKCKYQLTGFVKNQFYAENSHNQMDLYHKPEFVFVPNLDYTTHYKDNKFDDLTARYPLRMTPTTEL